MRIAFLGTPEFALPSLKMLIKSGHTLLVFTQPDKPQGRHAKMTTPPVKAFALTQGLEVVQPRRIRDREGLDLLTGFCPDLMVTAAYGQILSAENLAVPKMGCINVHGSLLPKYRGAAPIQWAVINGEKETGITTMMTDVGLDTGDILLQEKIEILPEETAGALYLRMAELGAKVLQETIARLISGTLKRFAQDHDAATKCAMLKKEDGKLDFSLPVQSIHDRVRGVNPWPGAYAFHANEPLKIWATRIPEDIKPPENLMNGQCFTDLGRLFICCQDGAIEVLALQAAGGKRMEASAYLRGKSLSGAVLI